jgi:hypothetical protein
MGGECGHKSLSQQRTARTGAAEKSRLAALVGTGVHSQCVAASCDLPVGNSPDGVGTNALAGYSQPRLVEWGPTKAPT